MIFVKLQVQTPVAAILFNHTNTVTRNHQRFFPCLEMRHCVGSCSTLAQPNAPPISRRFPQKSSLLHNLGKIQTHPKNEPRSRYFVVIFPTQNRKTLKLLKPTALDANSNANSATVNASEVPSRGKTPKENSTRTFRKRLQPSFHCISQDHTSTIENHWELGLETMHCLCILVSIWQMSGSQIYSLLFGRTRHFLGFIEPSLPVITK